MAVVTYLRPRSQPRGWKSNGTSGALLHRRVANVRCKFLDNAVKAFVATYVWYWNIRNCAHCRVIPVASTQN